MITSARICSACGRVDSEEIPVLADTPAIGDDSNIVIWSRAMVVNLTMLVVLLAEIKKRRIAK